MQQLLTKQNINICDEEGFSLLIWASIKGNKEACEALLKEGADVDIKDREGQTALYAAASRGHVEVCDLLLANKAHVNEQENSGATPLFIAAQEGHLPVCTLLLDNNAHVNGQTHNGATPLHIASQQAHVPVCTLLLERNAQVNRQQNDGFTPLMTASWFGHVELCKLLLQNNADINLKSKSGDSALCCAFVQKKYNVCKLLLQHGANLSDVNNDLQSVLGTINSICDQSAVSLEKEHENINDANKQVEEAQKKLSMLEIEQVIDIKRESLEKVEEAKVRLHQLKHLKLKKQKEKNDLEIQVSFLKQQNNERITRLNSLKTEGSSVKQLLQNQNIECEATIKDLLCEITKIDENINKFVGEIETLRATTKNYAQLEQEYEFCINHFQKK